MIKIGAESLLQFAKRLLVAGGLDGDEAVLVARSLVNSNLCGYDSHGVMRIPYYLDCMKKGEVISGAAFEVLKESDSVVAVDAHWGFGQTQAQRLTKRLIAKARRSGVAVGTMIHCSHIGRLGEYCETAAAAGLVAMLCVNNHGAVCRVAPPGGTTPRLGTNPIAFGVPHGQTPVIVDFGTSATAEGKVRIKRIAGQPCPEGWLLDSQGRPTTDPETLYASPPGSIRPMGGDQPYKGFALGLVVEILAGALSGGVCARQVPKNQIGNCVFMALFDPAHLGGEASFRSEVADLIAFIRGCPLVEGVERITLPGDPERESSAAHLREGLLFDEPNWSQLTALAERLGVEIP